MRYFLRILLVLVLLSAVVFVMLRAISWHDAQTAIHALSWLSILVMVGAVLLISVVKATRFFAILRFGDVKVSLRNTMRIFIASQAFTPMPAGELGRAMLFKKELGIHLHEVAGPVFLQALTELWTASLWVVFAVLFVGNMWGVWIIVFFILLMVLTLPVLFSKQIPGSFDALKAHGLAYAWIDKTKKTFVHFHELISSNGKTKAWRFWASVVGLGLLGHALGGGLIWYIASIEGAHLTFLQSVFAAAMAALIQGILTVIPGGLGVTEGGLVGIFTSFAVPWKLSIVVTLLYRVATLPLIILIAALFLIQMYGKNILRLTHIRST